MTNTPPNVLILSLSRFVFNSVTNRISKDCSFVDFPIDDLDVNELYGNHCIYDLYSLVCHRGDNPQVGHYTGI